MLQVNMLNSLQQLAALQYTLSTFTSQHAKQWLTEALAILNGSFMFDLTLSFSKVVHALDMEINIIVLELVDAATSATTVASLKSPVLRWYTAQPNWAREKIFQKLSADK